VGLTGVVLGLVAGAAAGLVYSATRPVLAKLGTLGDYLTGIVIMGGYAKPRDAILFGVITVGFGLFGAHQWRKNNRKPS
jgi:hypothetical protein